MILIWFLFFFGTALSLSLDRRNVIADKAVRRPFRPPPPPTRPTPPRPSPPFPSFPTFPNITVPKACGYQSYTALGDSYSAGLNYANGQLLPNDDGTDAPNNGGDVCLRNADSFPVLLQEAHNFTSFQFIACSGVNTTECDLQQVKGPDYGRPDLVSITIGGNNNQALLGLVVNCVYQRDDTFCQYAIANAQAAVSEMDGYLNTLFSDIITTNPVPRRRVVVVGYPRLWSTTDSNTCQHPALANVPIADRQAMNVLADGINAALKKAARKYGPAFIYADADALFEGNRLCDDVATPYLQYDFATAYLGVFHPTDVGQQKLFDAMEAAAGCS